MQSRQAQLEQLREEYNEAFRKLSKSLFGGIKEVSSDFNCIQELEDSNTSGERLLGHYRVLISEFGRTRKVRSAFYRIGSSITECLVLAWSHPNFPDKQRAETLTKFLSNHHYVDYITNRGWQLVVVYGSLDSINNHTNL